MRTMGCPLTWPLIQLELKVATTKAAIVGALASGDITPGVAKEKLDILARNADSVRKTLETRV